MEQTTTMYDPSVHSYNALPAPVLLKPPQWMRQKPLQNILQRDLNIFQSKTGFFLNTEINTD